MIAIFFHGLEDSSEKGLLLEFEACSEELKDCDVGGL